MSRAVYGDSVRVSEGSEVKMSDVVGSSGLSGGSGKGSLLLIELLTFPPKMTFWRTEPASSQKP
jgi:hypothetical protein